MAFYDVQIELSTNDGGISREKFRDGMRVRLFGSRVRRAVTVPVVTGAVLFVNDCDAEVVIKRGVAVPVIIGEGEIAHVLFDPETFGMRLVR